MKIDLSEEEKEVLLRTVNKQHSHLTRFVADCVKFRVTGPDSKAAEYDLERLKTIKDRLSEAD